MPSEEWGLTVAQLIKRKQKYLESVDDNAQDFESLFEMSYGKRPGMDQASKETSKRDLFLQGLTGKRKVCNLLPLLLMHSIRLAWRKSSTSNLQNFTSTPPLTTKEASCQESKYDSWGVKQRSWTNLDMFQPVKRTLALYRLWELLPQDSRLPSTSTYSWQRQYNECYCQGRDTRGPMCEITRSGLLQSMRRCTNLMQEWTEW